MKFLPSWWLAVALAIGELVSFPAEPAGAAERPNFLLLMADNWAWPHAGVYGDPVVKTPAFDALAREGMLFGRAYCSVPSCSPARAVLLTGQAAHRLADAASLHSQFPARLRVFPELLEEAGYAVGYSGKGWGPGNWQASGRKRNPAGESFADFDSFLKATGSDKPFCFWMSSKDPHVPWTEGRDFEPGIDRERLVIPKHLRDHPAVREDLVGYYCEVQNFDRDCGRLIDSLRTRGLLENTVILMLGDNGWQMPRGLAHMYDLSTHVPLVVRWPKRVKAGVCDDFVCFEDLAPTLLELAGMTPLPEMTGRSLLPILEGRLKPELQRTGRDAVFLERERHANVRAGDVGYPCRSIRTKDFLYIRNLRPDRWPAGDPQLHFAVGPYGDVDNSLTKQLLLANPDAPDLRAAFRLTFSKRPAEELYDLRADPGEIKNVAGEAAYAARKQKLSERLEAWMVATEDPRATSDDDRWDKFPYYGNPAKAAK
jgi:arylsulfatase A-like enzyme